MTRHRVKAFTIMEVTVAMLIASIAISIAYTVYTIVVKSYNSYNIKNSDMAVLVRLNELLKTDFEHADIILKDQKSIIFKNADRLVNYDVEPDFILRISTITDTFKVKTQEFNTTFENAPVTEIANEEEPNRIDELQLNLLFENKKISYYYHKQYSSLNLIQRNVNAVN